MKKAKQILRLAMSLVSYVAILLLVVICGILGYKIYRWEAIVWGIITLAWMGTARVNRKAAECWRDAYKMLYDRQKPRFVPVKMLRIPPED